MSGKVTAEARLNAYQELTKRTLAYFEQHAGDKARAKSKNELLKMLKEREKSKAEAAK